MKILLICQYYHPEPFRITDICEAMAARGHEITVIAGTPNYPMGKIYNGYRFGKRKEEIRNGVKIHRCFTIGRRSGFLFRLLNYYSYAISSSLYTAFLKEEFDVVFVHQLSPVMMACAGIIYKKRHHKKLVLSSLDLWPESLVAGGVSKKSPIFKFFHWVSRRIYQRADRILISSHSFASYFQEQFGICNTEYLCQYAEELFTPETCQKNRSEQSEQTVDLMFAGNVGAMQSVDTIIRAAALTKDHPRLRWHIVGDGSDYNRLKKIAADQNLTSVIFHGRQPVENMPEFYRMADAMLITLKADPVISLTLPGKIQTYMAAGKAVIGAINGEAARVIEDANCGFCCPAEDAEGLAKLAMEFSKIDHDDFETNSYRYYQENYEKEVVLAKLEKELSNACSKEL